MASGAPAIDEDEVKKFYQKHGMDVIINDMLSKLCTEKPDDIWACLHSSIDEARSKSVQVGSKASQKEGDCDIALIGMAVMGQNLIMNMADNGFKVCAHNRTKEKVDKFVQEGAAKGHPNVVGAQSTEDMCARLKRPRKIVLLVQAGPAADGFIDQMLPFLEKGDVIIDGGNTHYPDTIRRCDYCAKRGLLFIGTGVSGGEEGARYGPSIMPGGHAEAWPHVKEIFQKISAKAEGEPCCDWVGDGGAGHYVKMVHNGIEYGDMQVICEGYQFMRDAMGMNNEEMAAAFVEYNKGDLDSYLIEITSKILPYKDTDGSFLVENIRDTAGQKGTGKWTGIESLQLGVPVTLIGESVFARCLSAIKDQRVTASGQIKAGATQPFGADKAAFLEKLGKALLAAKIVSYSQGFMLLQAAAKENNWKLNYPGIALMWRGGCIIRSAFLGEIRRAFTKNPDLDCLLLDDYFKGKMSECEGAWREVVQECVKCGVPCPTLSTALAFWDGYRTERLPANLLQAQRDYFGAHTYERLEAPGQFHHTNWTGTGGDVASTTYNK